MSLRTSLYLGGMAALYVGGRLLGSPLDEAFGFGGFVAVVAAVVLHWQASTGETDLGRRQAHRCAVAAGGVALLSIGIWGLSTDTVFDLAGMAGEGRGHWQGVLSSLWPALWVLGTLPFLAVERLVARESKMVPRARVFEVVEQAVVAALALALVFPVNFLAHRHNVGVDLSHFKTSEPGPATRAVAASLEETIDVYAFFPPSNEVSVEVSEYFRKLDSGALRFHRVDHAAEPRLARALRVSENGVVVFVRGEIDLGAVVLDPTRPNADANRDLLVRKIRLAPEIDRSKRALQGLDGRVQRHLLHMSVGERVAYLTTGHGELERDTDKLDKSTKLFRQLLKQLNFTVKDLGLVHGLSERVPEDADLVVVLGATEAFHRSEVDALMRYLDSGKGGRGGALLLALEPEVGRNRAVPGFDGLSSGLGPLLDRFGLEVKPGLVAQERPVMALANDKIDRLNVASNQYTAHPVTQALANESQRAYAVAPLAAYLSEKQDDASKGMQSTALWRTLAHAWVDVDMDLEFGGDGETKAAYPLLFALEGGGQESASWRALVTADSTMFSDLLLSSNTSNQALAYYGVNWLAGSEEFSGPISDEQDVRIDHTKGGKSSWFYVTVLGIPALIVGMGRLRLRRRRRGSR